MTDIYTISLFPGEEDSSPFAPTFESWQELQRQEGARKNLWGIKFPRPVISKDRVEAMIEKAEV